MEELMFTYTAFEGFQLLSHGGIEKVALAVKKSLKGHSKENILIFSDSTGRQIDLDLSGPESDVLERLQVFASPPVTSTVGGVGRPKLGVVSREISLLPQHWEWLSNQDGGASSVIRRLIDAKMNTAVLPSKEKSKQSQETTYKFLSAIAGNLPNFEEVIRYLYRKDKKKFEELMGDWHRDLAKHALYLAKDAFN